MDYHAEITPFLHKLPQGVPDDFIALRARSNLICVPVPPWSTRANLDQTSGMLLWQPDDHDDIHNLPTITWFEPSLDDQSSYRMIPRNEPADSWKRLYHLEISTPFKEAQFRHAPTALTKTLKNNAHRIELADTPDRICAIDLYHDAFQRPMTCLSAVCSLRVDNNLVRLSHVQWCDTFDIYDDATWPVPRSEAENRVDYVSKLIVRPFIGSALS